MFCRHCHDYIPEDSRFCPKCGVRLWTAPPANRPWFWICTILLFAFIWATLAHKDFQAQLLNLRAQVHSTLNAL